VFDKKRKREGKEEEKKVNKKISPLFLIFSLSLPHLYLISLLEIKKNFRTGFVYY
jgi:hypothetical protein